MSAALPHQNLTRWLPNLSGQNILVGHLAATGEDNGPWITALPRQNLTRGSA
jgi:hypothetical protein